MPASPVDSQASEGYEMRSSKGRGNIVQRRHLTTDVLVVGNGGAGLRAAVAAAETGCQVIIASKIGSDRPNSTAVIAGWGAAVQPEEAESYFRTVVEEGNYLSDQELAWSYAQEAAEQMPELRRFGVEMRLDECALERPGTVRDLWYFPGPRGRLGDAIRKPLREAAASLGAVILDDTLVTRLLTSDSSVVGATALDLATGDLLVIAAKAVILATGGASGLYARQNNPAGTTGDGFALAYRAGAELVDMEFDTFMMSQEELEALFRGGLTDEQALSTAGAHYSCGGVKVDHNRCSRVDGLYAAGEVAGGTFGSARLGGSAVGDIVVSGCLAGENAAAAAARKGETTPEEEQVMSEEERLTLMLGRDGTPPRALREEVRALMWRKVGPVRRDAGLRAAVEELPGLRTRAENMAANSLRELRDAIETDLMLDAAEVIAAAALARTESRGAHWRLDHPVPDSEEWLRNIVISRGADGTPTMRMAPVSMTRITSPGPCRIGTAWAGGYVGSEP